MPEKKSRFVLVTQQALAVAVVGAVTASGLGVADLEIVPPDRDGGTLVAPAQGALVATAPVQPEVRTVPLAGGAVSGRSRLGSQSARGGAAGQEFRVVSAAEPVSGYGTVGVTWSGEQRLPEEQLHVEVRTLRDGTWSQWQEMHYAPEHGPDPADQDPADVRAGTEPVVVGEVEDVQVRVTAAGATPEGLALEIIDPGEDPALRVAEPAIDTGALSSSPAPAPAPAPAPTLPPTAEPSSEPEAANGSSGDRAALAAKLSAPRPKIFSRAQWGADEGLRDPRSLQYGEIHGGFVHHTVNANEYTKAQVPSILRGIYAYHTQSRGWSDVGYNFLVDRFGRIWEGRYGGVDRPVIGAHTLGYNDDAFAMSAVGNFETARPSRALLDAYGKLMAWKLALHDVDAAATRVNVGGTYFQAISGHRDAGATACPGTYLYAKLPQIRKTAAALQRGSTAAPVAPPPAVPTTDLRLNHSGARWPDLIVRDKATSKAVIVRTGGQISFKGAVKSKGVDLRSADLVAAVGDITGDRLADLVVRDSASLRGTVYSGTGSGTVTRGRVMKRFSGVDMLTGVGDFDGDGTNDLVGRKIGSRRLALYAGAGEGRFRGARGMAEGWGRYDVTEGVGDFDGDGRPDLVARAGQTLYLVPGTGRGVGRPVAFPGRWGRFDIIAGRGDATGDGNPDIIARSRNGRTFVYPGNGKGGLSKRIDLSTDYRGLRWLALAGQMAGKRKPDLVGIGQSGRLKVYRNTGRRNLDRATVTGTRLTGINLLLNVGDWNGDGRADVMTRDAATGDLHFRAGGKGSTLAPPVVAKRGWGGARAFAPVGDMTGDGYPDLVAIGANGAPRLLPSNGSTGFAERSVFRSRVSDVVDQVGLGFWDGDRTPDSAMRLKDGSLLLWSSEADATRVLRAPKLRRYDWVRGLGDMNGDGRADLVVRAARTGHLFLLPGRADGFGKRRLIGTGFGAYDLGG